MMWKETTNLKFFLLNAENLFLLFDNSAPQNYNELTEESWQRLSTSIYPNKALHKCISLAKMIRENDPDILMLCEVGGGESLNNFNKMFLNETYSTVLIEGNSDRNIDVGFLVKKNNDYYFDLLSNRSRPIHFYYPNEKDAIPKKNTNRFSRDVAELKLFRHDRENPFLIILHTHLKSRLDKDQLDPGGFNRRSAEVRALIEIYHEIEKKNPNVPIIISGDFNGNASRNMTDSEFQNIYTLTPWEDVLQLNNTPWAERATFYQIRNGSKTEGRQIDYCFLNLVSAQHFQGPTGRVLRYRDDSGIEYGIPTSLENKEALPSDHYPLIFTLSDLKIY